MNYESNIRQKRSNLKQPAKPIIESEFGSKWLEELVKHMFAIMKEKCAVGVAAPQNLKANIK